MRRPKQFIYAFILFCAFISLISFNAQAQKLKVLISVDMEGISGIVHSDFTGKSGYEYARARKLMTDEANAAVKGALAAGATEVIVNDSHGSMRNILIENLHAGAELITGSPKPLSMMQGIDESIDAVAFIGYHAYIGTQNGVLAHTMSSRTVKEVKINGAVMNEASLNAGIAGYYGIPVVFISGDEAVCKQAKEFFGDIETNVTMKGLSRFVAQAKPPSVVHKDIAEGIKKGLDRRAQIKPYVFKSPIKLEISFFYSNMADNAELIPGSKRVNSTTVSLVHDDYITLFKAMRAMLILASN